MSYIRLHSVERDASDKIVKSSAAIYQSIYKKTGKKNHCVPKQIERLGKVLWLSDDGKSGIFLSRGRFSATLLKRKLHFFISIGL